MADLDPKAAENSPLFRELVEIGKGLKPLPKADGSKRHHFIPKLTLRQFAHENDRLFQLDAKTGKPQATNVQAAGSRHRYYSFEDEEGNKSTEIEGYFAMVESHAAPALRRMDETGLLSDEDRATISFFLSLLWARTPAARAIGEELSQQTVKLVMASKLSDPKEFARDYREWLTEGNGDRELTKAEIEELRRRMIEQLQDGRIKVVDPNGGNVMALLIQNALDSADLHLGATGWALMRAEDGEFVTSDRGLACFDPTPRFPWSSYALASSPNSQTTVPISPTSCLLIVPTGEPSFEVGTVSQHEVQMINLRTYGWAERFIYGSSQEVVVSVRRFAKKNPQQIVRPRRHRPVILIERDADDTRLADAHAARGWPEYLQGPDESGGVREFDYMVIDEDGDAVDVSITTDELARTRSLRAANLPPNAAVKGSLKSGHIHPLAIQALRNS